MHLYDVSIAPLVRNLQNLKHILQQGELHAGQKKVEPEVILNSRLSVDMYPLTRQVQLVSDMSKGAGARLAGLEIPQYKDDETSLRCCMQESIKQSTFYRRFSPHS
jgi:uncharacterized protein